MSNKNRLIVPGVEQSIHDYKEEIAEEFGTHFSPASRDVITRKLTDEKKKKESEEDHDNNGKKEK